MVITVNGNVVKSILTVKSVLETNFSLFEKRQKKKKKGKGNHSESFVEAHHKKKIAKEVITCKA